MPSDGAGGPRPRFYSRLPTPGTRRAVAGRPSFARIIREAMPGFRGGPVLPRAEQLSPDEALAAFQDHEKESLRHTVWTFHTPFIGGLCSCHRADCLAMQATVTDGVPVMFRGESVAQVEPASCTGCRECMKACQFGALGFSAAEKKAVVDPRHCYGRGVCRAMCRREAIRLVDRRNVLAAANLW
ncbi:MAG TPA: 4Fe-4S binding protein [Phycisphaerae bacterium]|nr:4Fe-4S binding protein [Phycisphaerae bacterium]